MTGYQEILTDPSYRGQIVTMTVAHIGNVGVNPEDLESTRPWLAGYVVRELPRRSSNWRATAELPDWMEEHGVVGIYGVDTRSLVRHIRSQGALRGVVSTTDLSSQSLAAKAKKSPGLLGRDLVHEVTCDQPKVWQGPDQPGTHPSEKSERPRLVAYDFGIKHAMLDRLTERGLEVIRVPAQFTAEEALALKPDGVFLSNGPGDPAAVTYAVETIKKLLGKTPIFGICLGHQLLALALGGKTYKLKFGHRGANQPVKRISDGRVEITTQNHGFAVEADSLGQEVELTHTNLNDKTVEGLRHSGYRAFSVQYHPEASPGPHDSIYLFEQFLQELKGSHA